MSDEDILEKAIARAIGNGWDKKGYEEAVVATTLNIFFHNNCDEHGPEDFSNDYSPADIIFNHDFAKALWGEEYYGVVDGKPIEVWKKHLIRMVVAEDPIKYLEENI